jgi:hypothetical protein
MRNCCEKIWQPDDYLLCCCEAVWGNSEAAVSALRIALEKKLQTVEYIASDIDFDAIRGEAGYKRLIEEYSPYL